MTRYHQVIEKEENGGWSDWQAPTPLKYKMACCDCGLVHDLQFRVGKVTAVKKDGYFTFERVSTGLKKGMYRVLMRARRNKRDTAARRRAKP
jgi:hypothetical protein